MFLCYQREVDKGKLTAVASYEKLTFRTRYIRPSKVKGSRSKRHAAFKNSLQRLAYPYQLHVDN